MTMHVDSPADLPNLVGQTIGITDWAVVDQDQVTQFADATGDHQWIHTDPARAAKGPFGGTIAHGYLTLALSASALAEVLTIDNLEASLNYGLNKVRFPAPLPVGSKVRAAVAVSSTTVKPAGMEVVYDLTFESDGAPKPVCIAQAVVLYR